MFIFIFSLSSSSQLYKELKNRDIAFNRTEEITKTFDFYIKYFAESNLKFEPLLTEKNSDLDSWSLELIPFDIDDKILLRQMKLFKEFQDLKYISSNINSNESVTFNDNQSNMIENIPPKSYTVASPQVKKSPSSLGNHNREVMFPKPRREISEEFITTSDEILKEINNMMANI